MNKKALTLAAVAATMMSLPASAAVLVGFESWVTNNPNGGAGVTNAATITETGFSGNSITGTTGWGRSSLGSNTDGTFGTLAGAETTVAFNRGLALNNGANGSYNFTITNGSTEDYELEFFHFDTGTFRPNAAHEWEVSILAGGDLTAQSVESGSADNITGGVTDWYDYDIDLSTIAGGNVLAAGESVTFQLNMTGGTGASGHHQYLDNIAISGVVPEPSTYALLGGFFALSFVALRRRI